MTNILNWPDYKVLQVSELEHDYQIHAEVSEPPTHCPHCNHPEIVGFGRRDEVVMDTPVHGKRTGIMLNRRRFRCQSCRKTFLEPVPHKDERRQMTNRLMRGSTVVMSNTPMEIRTNRTFVRYAKGNVLINGLGLGMVLTAILRKPEVESVTVIEAAAEVIELVAPTFRDDPRVEIVHANAFDYQPPKGMRFDAVWHDIWDFISAENLPEMHRLHRKYGQRTPWQASWCRIECELQRSRIFRRDPIAA